MDEEEPEPPIRGQSAEHDFGSGMEQFLQGLAVLRRDGAPVGHVATSLGTFRSLFSPFKPRPWVWLVVVWDDGMKERAVEDYPPWTYVAEMRAGSFEWEVGRDGGRAGRYEIDWIPREHVEAEWARLGIRQEDF